MTRCLIGFSCLVRSLANAVAPVSRKVAVAAVLLCLSAAAARAATWTVDTLNDDSTTSAAEAQSNCASGNSGTCALRDAILAALPGDTVTFSVTGTITLSSALPVITRNLSVVGPGANQLTISGAGQYQVFYVRYYELSISGVTIANGNASAGGGIENLAKVLVTNCTFSGNTAYSGGAIYNAGTLTLSGSTFMGNSASESGGAIVGGGGTITDSTFSGNSAANGGGVYLAGSHQTVTNSTFVANSASVGGGGIYIGAGTLTVNNSIFSGNLAPVAGGGIFNGGSGTVNAGNDVYFNNQNGDCFGCSNSGSSDAGSNPLALPLGYYGGTTETYLPQPGSAAICAGSASIAASAGLSTDQRGFALDASCEYSGNVDAGAVQTNPYVVTTLTDQTDLSPDCTSGTGSTCSLRDAIGLANTTPGDITFLPSLTSTTTPGTITLGTDAGTGDIPLPAIDGQMNIIGPGANQLTISGNNDANVGSVFTVNSGATATLYGLTIANGNNTSGSGGGINNQGTLTAIASAVSANQASNGLPGGGISNAGTLTLTGSTVSGNTAAGGVGGGIFNAGTLTATESTISGNADAASFQPGQGGGIDNGGTLTLTGSTVSGNSASCNTCAGGSSGGGIYSYGTLTASNSIVAGNTTAGTLGADDCDGCGTQSSSNLIGGTPELSQLQYNGLNATLQTMIPLPDSPAICVGSYATDQAAGLTTDERGYPLQPTNGYCPAGTVDAGAAQTNYTSLAFLVQPSSVAVNAAMSPAPTVQVVETDTLLSTNNTDAVNVAGLMLSSSNFTLSDSSSQLQSGYTESTSSGSIALDGLTFSGGAATGDTLTANLTLNPNLSPPLAISATSAPFCMVQATPAITTLPMASAITYGQTLASSALTGGSAVSPITSANVPGSFAFATPSSTPLAGTQPESVTFTPNDTSDFSSVTSTVSVQVSKAPTNVTVLPIASAILSGQTLASSTLAGGTAVSTITGATVPGTFTFTTPSTAPTSTAGQSVTFTPTDANDFLSTATSVSVTVTPAQSITFSINAPASAAYNNIFTVAATASSGLPVAFTSSGSCTNVGAIYTMTSGTGTCSVIANQAGNTSSSAATTVIQATSATPAAQTITFSTNAPGSAAYNSSFTVAASGGASGNPVTYTSTGSCSSSSATYTMTSGTGSCSVIANQAGNTNFAAAPQVTETVNATPTAITASVTASNKVYDGTTTATITACTLIGVTIGDAGKVSCTANGPNTFASANPGTNITVTATNITLSGPAAGNYRLGSTTATTTASITYNFIGLEAPYAPPPTTFNVTRTMPLAWQYTNASGAVVNSAAANPTVQISGPYACGGTDTAADITINSAGASGYQYSSTTNTWQFNWQIKGNAPGCYNIYIVSGQTGQSSGPYPIEVVSH